MKRQIGREWVKFSPEGAHTSDFVRFEDYSGYVWVPASICVGVHAYPSVLVGTNVGREPESIRVLYVCGLRVHPGCVACEDTCE